MTPREPRAADLSDSVPSTEGCVIALPAMDNTHRPVAENPLSYYAAIIESSDDAIIGETPDGIITSWNPGAERMFGYSASDAIGRSAQFLIPPDHSQEENDILDHIRRGNVVRGLETVRQRQDGQRIDVSLTVSPLFDAHRQVIGAVKIARDIAARKQAEQLMANALQEVMQLKFALDEHAIVAITDAAGVITYVNEKFCAISQYSQEELIGHSHRKVESGCHSKDYVQELWDTTRSGRVWKGELQDRAKDGSTYWTQATIVPLLDSNGKPQQYVAIRTDISEQKRAAEALLRRGEELQQTQLEYRAQAALLDWVFESIEDGVVVVDQTGRILLLNRMAERLIGAARGGLQHQEWLQECGVFLADTKTAFEANDLPLSRAMRGETVDGEMLFVRNATHPQGVWLSVVAHPLHDHHSMGRGAVMVFHDASEAKRAAEAAEIVREAEAANRAKNEFLSRMSHELRTPLNAIIGFAQLLEYGALDPDQRESVMQIGKAGRNLLLLVNQVLDIASIEAGRLTLSVEPVLAVDAIKSPMALVQPIADQFEVALAVRPSPHWQECVLADQQRLQQILLNLLSNAVKFNRLGGQVTVHCSPAASGRIRLEVQDTGIGIPKQKMPLLFRPFERLDAGDTGIEGAGIGLALSRRLAEVMGGELGVESETGRGSTFWVELPGCENPLLALERGAGTADAPPDSPAPAAKTVLYVEDNPSNSILMERIIAHRPDLKLLSAGQGGLGLELARSHRPALILLDLHLPDVPGDEVLRRLKAEPESAQIPVAVITAESTPSHLSRLLEAGALACFSKPIDVKVLLSFFDETLSQPGA